MLRFGENLGTLDREVSSIKLMHDVDPDDFAAILSHDKEKATKTAEKLLHVED